MRLIKGVLFVFVGLSIMITLFSLLIPSQVVVTKGVVVNGNFQTVFAEVNDLKNWNHWLPLFKADSTLLHSCTGDGLNSYCDFDNQGKKNKLFIDSLTSDRVEVILSREGETDVRNTIRIFPLADSNSVQVEWRAVTKLKWYPWEKFRGIFIEKMSGDTYDEALNSLKAYVERR